MKRPSYMLPLGLFMLVLLSFALALISGTAAIGPMDAVGALFGFGTPERVLIIQEIRFPRALAAFVAGAALGSSGAALQGLLRNPLAEPGVLGVTAAASLGGILAIYTGLAALGGLAIPVGAILGALAATVILAFAAVHTRSVVTLILIGIGISAFAGALIALVVNLAENPFALSEMMNWTLGSVSNRSLDDIVRNGPFVLIGLAILFFSRRGLSALSLGEETASGLGVNLGRQRSLTVLGAGIATGGAVAMAGAIGFVGIVAPHVMRRFVGHDPGRSLLPSAVFAGALLVLADCLIRVLPSQTELRLGVVAALVGAPAFLWIAARRQGANGDA